MCGHDIKDHFSFSLIYIFSEEGVPKIYKIERCKRRFALYKTFPAAQEMEEEGVANNPFKNGSYA